MCVSVCLLLCMYICFRLQKILRENGGKKLYLIKGVSLSKWVKWSNGVSVILGTLKISPKVRVHVFVCVCDLVGLHVHGVMSAPFGFGAGWQPGRKTDHPNSWFLVPTKNFHSLCSSRLESYLWRGHSEPAF